MPSWITYTKLMKQEKFMCLQMSVGEAYYIYHNSSRDEEKEHRTVRRPLIVQNTLREQLVCNQKGVMDTWAWKRTPAWTALGTSRWGKEHTVRRPPIVQNSLGEHLLRNQKGVVDAWAWKRTPSWTALGTSSVRKERFFFNILFFSRREGILMSEGKVKTLASWSLRPPSIETEASFGGSLWDDYLCEWVLNEGPYGDEKT